jgi:hypothetical protein
MQSPLCILLHIKRGMQRSAPGALICLLLQASGVLAAEDPPVLKNWFNDPYFQVSDGIRNCPVPRGPYLTEAEKIAESHGRAERGTSCWMAGKCALPNAYLYDAAIAENIRQKLAGNSAIAEDSLWITVSRRFVWVQGCVARESSRATLEALLRSVPDVDLVMVDVMQAPGGAPDSRAAPRPPYKTMH